MIWLNATLAFALAMIIFCTMVTGITEAVHQCFSMRHHGLERMLGQLFEKVVCPRLGVTADAGAIKKDFLDTLTSNPAVEQNGWLVGLRSWFAPRTLDYLTLAQFAERFADTELGKQLWSTGPERAIQMVDDIGHRFQRFEEGATSYFAQRAQMLSLLVAILLAFALNVDAIRLFTSFLTDQQLTARILAEAEPITRQYQTKVVEGAPGAPTVTVKVGESAAAAPTGQAQEPPSAHEQSASATAADYRALDEKVDALNQQIGQSTALGLPIGAAYYPWCLDETKQPTCQTPLTWEGLWNLKETDISMQGIRRFGRWFVAVLLAGVLIGLGGPFWFNAFSHLSAFVRLLGAGSEKKKSDAKDADLAPQAPVEVPQPKTPGETFAVVAARAEPKSPRGRMLLTISGMPL